MQLQLVAKWPEPDGPQLVVNYSSRKEVRGGLPLEKLARCQRKRRRHKMHMVARLKEV